MAQALEALPPDTLRLRLLHGFLQENLLLILGSVLTV